MRHQAGTSARAPGSCAISCRSCPGGIVSRRRRSSSTSSPQPRSPASQWATAGCGTGVLALMLGRAAPLSIGRVRSRRDHHEAYSEAAVLQVATRCGRDAVNRARSYAQVSRLDRFVAQQLGRAGFVDDRALAHEVDVVGDPERKGKVLLDDQDGRAAGLEPAEDAPELAHQEGRQAFGGLVHQQDVGVADQRPPAREHLLLAAGELIAAVLDPLAEPREEIEHPAEAPARAVAGALADLEMLAHAERGKDAATLRHQAYAAPRDLVRGQARDVLAAEQNAAAARRREADDRADQRGLADAVAAEHRDDLAPADPQRDTLQDVAVAVVGVDVLDVKHRPSPDRSPPPRGRS